MASHSCRNSVPDLRYHLTLPTMQSIRKYARSICSLPLEALEAIHLRGSHEENGILIQEND